MGRRPTADDDLDATRVRDISELQQELLARSLRDRAYLIVLKGSNVGEMFRLEGIESDGTEAVLGRSGDVTVRLHDDGISRRHAKIRVVDGDVQIEDMQSVNGTYVNDELITKRSLRDGDKIRVGSTTILKFTYSDHFDEKFQQQMYDAAQRDGLTKAFNKRYFLDRLEGEVAYARRHRSPLSLLMLDVDHFKSVNDNHGHLAGDEVLVELTKIGHRMVRAEDIFARYGGEEFGVICRGVTLANAGILGERLRAAVETHAFEFGEKRLPVTISVGVAAYPDVDVEAVDGLIAAADEALFEAKRGGRNRVLLKYGATAER